MNKLTHLFILVVFMSTSSAQYIPKFDLQGHRGARGLKPENTIPAFIESLNHGVTTIELDVVITKDNQIVVSHEPWMSSEICLSSDSSAISKETERKHNIFQMTYAEVARYDCGVKGNIRFPEQEKISTSKPLLKDVIIAVENHIKSYTQYEVDYNIEIKSLSESDKKFHPGVEEFSELVFNLINDYLPWERIVIQSFDFRVLKYWHKKYPQIRLAALVENTKPVNDNLNALGFNPSVYSPYFKLLTKNQVDSLRKKKIRVIPWTVNEVNDMLSLKEMGVDGFITDYPNRAAELGFGVKGMNGKIPPNGKR